MGLSLGINEKLCVVINEDLFKCLIDCAGYSDEFLYKRLSAFNLHGVPTGSVNPSSNVARKLRSIKAGDTVTKYVAARQIVISNDLSVGSFIAGYKPYSVVRRVEGQLVTGGSVTVKKASDNKEVTV